METDLSLKIDLSNTHYKCLKYDFYNKHCLPTYTLMYIKTHVPIPTY